MHNVVRFPPDRFRPRPALDAPRDGARILFFTGVRYCRDDNAEAPARGREPLATASGRVLDAAVH